MRALILVVVFFVARSLAAEDACRDLKTCGTCLGFPADKCVWCSAPNVPVRCQSVSYQLKEKNWCQEKFVSKQIKENIVLNVNKPLQSGDGKTSAVQFRPQQITVQLGPGQETTFEMSFKHAKDFPLDVYFLMDYSYTMDVHVKALRMQSQSIRDQLVKYTNNVFFGLGSFIDKPTYPFVGTNAPAYTFRHHVNLTPNITTLVNSLNAKESFGNYDLQEAGLDALMQVMVCQKEFEWRPNANRIIILFTDASYHSAGDGKLVLAYKPNDMKCHLNASGYYNYDLILDYPSISQIRRTAADNKFRIIFAIHGNVNNTYTSLAQAVGAKCDILIGENNQKSNVFSIVKSAYEESVRYLTINHQFPPFVQLKLSPDCTQPQSADCSVSHHAELKIKATLKVTSCPKNTSEYFQHLQVRPAEGGMHDNLEINLEITNCQCECEKDKNGEHNSPKCSKAGTFQCGICACDKQRSGDICECDDSAINSKIDLEECRQANDTKFCSRRGNCKCRKCHCYRGYSGKFCQFDDNSCKKRDNQLCSGHGRCTLGECACDSDLWTGDDCGCSTLKHNCYAFHSKEECSGNGQCICNECVCNKIKGKDERYSGVFCEDCEECAEKRCKELEEYAVCNFLYNQTYCDEQTENTIHSNIEVQKLNKTEINASKWPTAKWCNAKLDEKKTVVFLHSYDKFRKKLILIIQSEAQEMPKPDIWVPVGIAIATVVLIGLLTVLVWKLIVDAMDEREYNRFQKQAQSEGFDVSDNPLYQPASANFSNPTYNQNSVADGTIVQTRNS